MIRWFLIAVLVVSSMALPVSHSRAEESESVRRGRKALLERAFNTKIWSARAYDEAWRQWQNGAKAAPPRYAEAFQERYGLHPAPYANGDLPMGLRRVFSLLGAGITTDCLMCHGGSIAGQSYVGLGNASLDMQGLYQDLALASGRSGRTPFTFSHVRGTTEAGAMAVYLFGWREPDLKLRGKQLDLELREDLFEDPPAWWLLKKKKTMYHTGAGDARSVRSLMQFMLSPLNGAEDIKREETTFADIRAYLLSLEPPRYPFPIDEDLARAGKQVFQESCARCHGTYGKDWTYPNKIVPLDVIGTDRNRYNGLGGKFGIYYNQGWFAQEDAGWLVSGYPAMASPGYQAPPLDGIWATAPYLHNGSVPTVYHLLNSKVRPKVYTRSFRTGKEHYDPVKLGWKIQESEPGAGQKRSAYERRKIYDTTQPGRGNTGHTFGDSLNEDERRAVIEYLKTL